MRRAVAGVKLPLARLGQFVEHGEEPCVGGGAGPDNQAVVRLLAGTEQAVAALQRYVRTHAPRMRYGECCAASGNAEIWTCRRPRSPRPHRLGPFRSRLAW